MAKRGNPLRHIKLVYTRTPRLTKMVVLLTVVLSTVTLLAMRGQLLKAQADIDATRQQVQQLEQDKQDLQDRIDALGTPDSVDQIAKEELDLVDPDSVIFQPEG